MYLHILIGQRREDYPGQYGLEDLGSMTEYDVDVNPAYLRDREVEIRSSGEFDRLAWVRAEVDEDAVDAELARDDALEPDWIATPAKGFGIRFLFGRRRGHYPGEYGLESVASMDEYGLEHNPDYLAEQADAAVVSREFAALGFVDLSLELAAVRAILYPEDRPLPATLLTGGTA